MSLSLGYFIKGHIVTREQIDCDSIHNSTSGTTVQRIREIYYNNIKDPRYHSKGSYRTFNPSDEGIYYSVSIQ